MSQSKAYKPTHGGYPSTGRSTPAHKQTDPDKKPGQIVTRPYDHEFPEPVAPQVTLFEAMRDYFRDLVRGVIPLTWGKA